MAEPHALPIGHTNEARALVEAGTVRPGDKILDAPVDSMTDREILTEMLIHARNTRDTVNSFVEAVNNSTIGKMIVGGGNPLAGMSFGGPSAG